MLHMCYLFSLFCCKLSHICTQVLLSCCWFLEFRGFLRCCAQRCQRQLSRFALSCSLLSSGSCMQIYVVQLPGSTGQ